MKITKVIQGVLASTRRRTHKKDFMNVLGQRGMLRAKNAVETGKITTHFIHKGKVMTVTGAYLQSLGKTIIGLSNYGNLIRKGNNDLKIDKDRLCSD